MASPRPPPFLLSTALLLLVTASPLSGPGFAAAPDGETERFKDSGKVGENPISTANPPPNAFPTDYPILEWATRVVPASDSVKNDACRIHSKAFLRELRRLTPWAIRMMDANGKIPPGLLEGNIRSLGHFDQCLKIRADLSSLKKQDWRVGKGASSVSSHFKGKYCLASLEIEAAPSPNEEVIYDLIEDMTLHRRHLEKEKNMTAPQLFPLFSLFEWAVCMPSSCTARDLEISLNDAVGELAAPFGVKASAMVTPESCYVDTPTKMQEADYFMVTFIAFFVLLMVSSSLYDVLYISKRKEKGAKDGMASKIFLAFSAPANWEKLFNTDHAPAGSLECIDGIRFLSTLWVVITHKVLTFSQEPWVNKSTLIAALTHWSKMPLVNSMLNVDTFFLVSGLLKSYHFMKELDEGRFSILSSYAQRYLRLTPAYGVVIGFYSTLLIFLDRGPTWNKYMGTNSEVCRDNWFLNLLYVNNYIGYSRMCLVQSWYLAADMQLCLLSPLIVYPLWKWPRKGAALLTLAVAVSIALPFASTYANNYPGFYHVGTDNNILNDYMQYVYMATHNRMSPYLVGLALGCLLHKLRAVKVTLTKMMVACGWVVSLAVMWAVVFGPYDMFQYDHKYNVIESSFFGGFHRFAWAVAVGWLIFSCSKGYGGFINSFLSANFFKPLSRLSYCMFLTHIAVLIYGTSRLRAAIYVDEYTLLHGYVGDVFITLIVSIFLHMCFEAPFLILVKLMFGKARQARKVQSEKPAEDQIAPPTVSEKVGR